MKRIIAAALIVMAASAAVSGNEYRESSNADISKAPWMAYDGDRETWWNLSEGETEGFIETVSGTASKKSLVRIDCEIPWGAEIQLYEETGSGRTAVPGCSKSGPYEGLLELELPSGRRESTVTGIRLSGRNAGGIRIREIETEEKEEEEWGKITPSSYEFNLEEQINIKPSRLWDGKISGAWYEPVWYVPYEITSVSTNRAKEIFGKITGAPSKDAVIVWNLDGEYEIETVKVYIQRSFRSIRVEYEENGRWKEAAEIGPYGQNDESWARADLSGIRTEKLRLTFPGGWEQARYISEFEAWGTRKGGKEKEGTGWKEIRGTRDSETGSTWYIFESEIMDLEIEAGTEGTEGSSEAYLNGEKLELKATEKVNGNRILCYEAEREMLRNGEQFLKIENPGVRSLLVRERREDGKLDGTVKKASYEKLIEIKEDGSVSETRIYGSTRLPKLAEDTVRSEAYGSILEDDECDVELYRPWTEDEEWNGYIIGWTGNSQAEIKVNGMGVSRSDHIFYLPASSLSWSSVSGKLKVEGKDGKKTFEHTYAVKGGKKQAGGELYTDEGLEYTAEGSITISGKASGRNAEVYVNGEKTGCDRNGKFSTEAETGNGYRKTVIEIIENGRTTAYWTKETFAFTDEIQIELSGSESGILTTENTWTLKGSAYNAGEVRVYIDGEEVKTESGHFEKEISLEEGENTVTVRAEDRSGRSSEKTIVITRDTTPPLFEITKPEEGAYLAESLLEIKALSDEKGLWYEIEGSVREYAETEEYTKTFELEDDFYSWKIAAYDRLGNRSKTTVLNFCIDTEMPEEFEIIPDVPSSIEKWRDTNDVTVEFGTTDATSGVEKYEYILDGEDWKECSSPLNLGVLEDGKHILFVRAVDRAGNIRLETLEIYVDVTAPLSFEQWSDIEAETWTSCNEPVLYFGTTDETSGVRNYTLSIDGAKEFDFTDGEKIPVQEDGKHVLTVTAYDRAGNSVSSTKEYWLDVTPPESFGSSFDIEGWSSNSSPEAAFMTTDATSGILKFELKLDGGTWKEIKSPYKFEKLEDGIHSAIIRAVDKAGNCTETDTYRLHIDTTAPEAVTECRLIPGNGNMEGRWYTEDTDIIAYHITWKYGDNTEEITNRGEIIWKEDGTYERVNLPECFVRKEGLANGKTVELTVYAEDRAHNMGPETSAVMALTGITAVPVVPGESTLVEYDSIKLMLSAQEEGSSLAGILVQETVSEGMTEAAVNPVVSPIYTFTALVRNEDGSVSEEEHYQFEKEIILVMDYDESLLPEGLSESMLDAYYYDDTWGRWFRAEGTAVDTEQNKIIAKTNHFTSFSVQPTLLTDLTPEEMKSAGHAYGNTESRAGEVTVSAEGGTVMTESTEFVIHGKNGFEFPLKRIYDSQTAKTDGPSLNASLSLGINFTNFTGAMAIAELAGSGKSYVTGEIRNLLLKAYQRNGDYNLGMGAGWRLGLPYVAGDNSGMLVRMANGSYYQVNQMECKGSEYSEYSRVITYENHSGDDFTVRLTQTQTDLAEVMNSINCRDYSSILSEILNKGIDSVIKRLEKEGSSGTSSASASASAAQKIIGIVAKAASHLEWGTIGAEITTKDGTTYVYNGYGRIEEIRDASGTNVITFGYQGNVLGSLIDTITDPYGNEIKVEYQNASVGSMFMKPVISKITAPHTDGTDRVWEYKYDYGVDSGLTSLLFYTMPSLEKATDSESRETGYQYDTQFLLNGGGSAKVNVIALIGEFIQPLGAIVNALGYDTLTLSAHFGLEWPVLLKTVTAPEKGMTEVEYEIKDLSEADLHGADYLFGIEWLPTSAEIDLSFFSRVFGKSVTVKDGNLEDKTEYNYSLTIVDGQHLTENSTVENSRTKTVNYYDRKEKKYNRTVSWQEGLTEIVSGAIGTTATSFNQKSYYSQLKETAVYKKGSDVPYETTSYEWYNTGRIKTETAVRGNVSHTNEYEYDNWGNVTKQTETISRSENGKTEKRTNTTLSHYYETDSNAITGFPSSEIIPATEKQAVSGTKGLLIEQKKSDGKQTVYTAYAYDKYGRNVWSGIYTDDGQWAGRVTEYREVTENDKITSGLVSRAVSAEGYETVYTYRTAGNDLITHAESETEKGKDGSEGVYVTTESAQNINTLWKAWEEDGNGNRTSWEYDRLGRITKITHPGNIYEAVSYDDTARTVTVSQEDGKVHEKYIYDVMHNLLSQETYDYKKNSSGKTITVNLEYDILGNVTKLTDQNGNETEYEYDILNRVTRQSNPDGTFISIEYDDAENTKTTTDENGHQSREYLTYDGLTVKLVQNPGGGLLELVTVTEYDGNGRPVKVTDPMNQVTTTEYSVFGKEKKITRPSVTVYEGGNSRTVTPVETAGYNKDGLPVIHMTGYEGNWRVEETGYDGTGRAVSKKIYGNSEENARTVTYTYDGAGNVTAETQYVQEKDESGKEVTRTYTRTWTYTERNQKRTETDPCNATVTYTYDRNDQTASMTDAMGNEAEYVYDDYRRLIEAVLPAVPGQAEKNTVTITYDDRGNALSMTEADGRTTTWTYDSRNRKTSETVGGSTAGEKTEKTYEYDDAGNLTAETAGGYRTEYTYDALNRLSETEKPDGQKLTNTYDKLGRVTKTEDAEGNTKQYEYNSLNFVTRQTDEGGDITDYGCSVWGEQTYRKEHNEGGSGEQVWNITYDAYGEITEEEKNDGSIWMYEYDERGLVTGKTEPNGTEASYTYDACGRVTKETRTAENNTRTETKSYSYDKNGFMLSATDNGVTTSYNGGTSNAYGLITKSSTTAGGKTLVTSYTYDRGLRVSEIAYPDSRIVNYTYNSTGFLKAAGSGKKAAGNTTAYAKDGKYNTAGQLTSLTAGNGKETTRSWNATEGTLSSYSWGLSEYSDRALTWDVRGNITSIKKGRADSPYTNTYSYDVRNRLVSETNGAKVNVKSSSLTGASYRHAQNDVSGKADGSLSSQAVKLDYNAASVIIDLGSDREITSLNIYGRNGRIDPQYLEVWTKESSSEGWQKVPVASLSWNKTTEGWSVYFIGGKTAKEIKLHSTWDERDADYSPVDRSTFSALVKNIFEVSFTADGKTSSWIYDAKGNRLSETESTGGIYSPSQSVTYYPNTDLIKTYGEWKFNYDRNGSLTSRGKTAAENPSVEEPFASWNFDAGTGEVWYYEYDLSGRMTKSSSSKKGTSGLTERAAYAYDWRGLLVKKTYAEFTADEGVSITGGSTVKVTEWYEYTQDGRLLYTEKSSGSVTTKTDYIWAEATLWCEVDDGEVYYHHTDHLGTTEAVTDSKGKVVWHAEYEAFGSVLSENGSMAFTPGFTGKMFDECSGLYYFNARWYDSECGRFTTSDPVRDGVNFHNYCNGNPLTRIDWTGLEEAGYNFGKGNYGILPTFSGIDTGNKWYNNLLDKTVSYGLIGTYNLLVSVVNYGFNVAGYTNELIDKGCEAVTGMDTATLTATMMSNGLLAPAGVMLNGFNTYMNGLKLANTSKVATTAIEVGQTAVNMAASTVGIDNYYNQNRLFWSGWGDAGVTAEKFAIENGMTTLEMTLTNPPSFLDNPKYWNGVNGVSANFAKTASGDVTALLIPNFSFNYPGANTFKDLEFGLLLENSEVTSINLIW